MFDLKIRNDGELRTFYHLLRGDLSNANKELVIEIKQSIRQYLKAKDDPDRRLARDRGIDGYVELIRFPDFIDTKEEAEEWFECEEKLTYEWSPYDCTGQLFTAWHHCFFRHGYWYCYHCVSCDV